jgi:hypothetical protein
MRYRGPGSIRRRDCRRATSGLYRLIKDHLAGGASRLAALLLPQILPVFSVVAPCHPGAALRDLVLVQPIQATRRRYQPRWR